MKLIKSEMEYYNNIEDDENIPEIDERNKTDLDILHEDNDDIENDYDSDEVTEDSNEIDDVDKINTKQIKVEQDIDILPVNTVHSVKENNNENKSSKIKNDTTTQHNLRIRKEGTHRNAYEKDLQNMQHQIII